NLGPEMFSKGDLQKRFPQFSVDFGFLDNNGGFLDMPKIARKLLRTLDERGVKIIENYETESIAEVDDGVRINTSKDVFIAKKVVITAGIWAKDVIKLVTGN